ncbi:MAG: hypothetical protein JWN25_2631 [Verrucomicrobiales bacterium]|nr:hypothetical protein [Verrucomicrobiales bacterium]
MKFNRNYFGGSLLTTFVSGCAALLSFTLSPGATAAPSSKATQLALEKGFDNSIHPFLDNYCLGCHGGKDKIKGELDLRPFTSLEAVALDERRWKLILDQVTEANMPPEEAKKQPSPEERKALVEWIKSMRKHVAERNPGDPGVVLARRLSNAEYDYSIRDLTGVDIRPTREFPVDPANQSGFDNTGESLSMSPSLVKKYLEAARNVADHLVLKHDGLAFAPHPVIADTDRDKYCVNKILEFYHNQSTDIADYLVASWKFRFRKELGKPKATLESIAAESKVSPKYLKTVWNALQQPGEDLGPLAALQSSWRALPNPTTANLQEVRKNCEVLRNWVVQLRNKVKPEVRNLTVRGMNPGAQAVVLWKDRQMAANRTLYGGLIKLDDSSLPPDPVSQRVMATPSEPDAKARYAEAFKRFCAIFPDAFYISERGRVFIDNEEKGNVGRYLSAGFHNQMGYFRDDGPLYNMLLNENQQRELDGLWEDFNYVSSIPTRQYMGLIWFERSESSFLRGTEFDIFRAEDKDTTTEVRIKQFADLYVSKVERTTTNQVIVEAAVDHFKRVNQDIRGVEKTKEKAEPIHLQQLQVIAEKAYRRPLTTKEKESIVAFYRELKEKDALSHEDAIRDTLVRVLMSPNFNYRVDIAPGTKKLVALSDFDLASRLSYFLWSSLPDEELLKAAASGDLHKPAILARQVRRMMKDAKIQGLATEFAGNWLDFRRFQAHNAVDRERFNTFNDDLREAMFVEPVRFTTDVLENNRSILDFLFAKDTFVNPTLARHYGMPVPNVSSNTWVHIDDATPYQRGGILPMSVFLTKNAPGLRTSPVKRGYWVVRNVLGEHIPAPPPKVPELPADESKLGELTLRETLAKHREDKLCATCHARFDAVGLVFEGFGPVGDLRKKDMGGRPVDTHALFPDGSEGSGMEGLKTYLGNQRKADFLDNFCRKLLSYGLGRTLQLSDEATITQMLARLKADNYRVEGLIETIVTSPQFLNKRGQGVLVSN